jgi:hypothetical protein
MAILQISKIQQRSGNLVDLPQLDDAEFGWANDARRLFIGKSTPNENIEVLTSYSAISFSQVDGAVGNLNISPVNLADGQLLAYNGTDWVNRGGAAGGLITLGDVGNIKLTGGAIGYVLQTDGLGNLSWAPKGTLVSEILNVSRANPAVVTTTSDSFFTNGAQVTIVDPQGMTALAGNIYYANVLTSTTFSLYSTFSGNTFSNAVNSTGYNAYSYTTVSATTVSTNVITVANSSPFTIGSAVKFVGNMSTSNISNALVYYVQSKPNTTSLKISTTSDANISNVVPLQTTTGLTAQVYQVGGKAVSTIGSGVTLSPAGGVNTTIQYNANGSLQGSGAFTYDYGNGILNLVGNANVGNIGGTIGVFTTLVGSLTTAAQPNITSVGTLTSLAVTGNVLAANFVGVLANGNSNVRIPASNGNVNISAIGNANVVVITGTGANIAGTLAATGNANLQNLGTAQVLATANVTAPQLISNIATGTAPFIVTSTTQVANLSVATAGSATTASTAGTVTTAAQPNITSVGTLTSLTVTGNIIGGNVYANTGTVGAGNVLTTTLTTGANTTAGSIIGNWTLTAGSRLQSTYADLAEYYEADNNYLPGTVLMFGGDKEVTIADSGTNKVAGVVSTNPAYVMNTTCPGLLTAIALQGRVPCKVQGNISKGDMLISGGNGFAVSTSFPLIGTVIGKALEDFSGVDGVIEVAVGRI